MNNNKKEQNKADNEKKEKQLNTEATFEKLKTSNIKELKTLDELLKEKP